MQDVSCNEITALPQQIGQLKSLRELNVRRNYLKVLPPGKKQTKNRWGRVKKIEDAFIVLVSFVKRRRIFGACLLILIV